MSIEERAANLEGAFLALNILVKRADERHGSLDQTINLLTELIQRHDERLDRPEGEESNADIRIAALADAQIRTEEGFIRTKEGLDRLEALMERHVGEGHDRQS